MFNFDYILNFNIGQKPWLLLGVGILYGIIYFLIFTFLIKKFNLNQWH